MKEEKVFNQAVGDSLFHQQKLSGQIRYHQYSLNNCYDEFAEAKLKLQNFLVQSTLGFRAYLFVEERKCGHFNRIECYWGIWKRLNRETSLCFPDQQEARIAGSEQDVLLGICNFTPELAGLIDRNQNTYVLLVREDCGLFRTIVGMVRQRVNTGDMGLESLCQLFDERDVILVQYADYGEDIALNYYYRRDSSLINVLTDHFTRSRIGGKNLSEGTRCIK